MASSNVSIGRQVNSALMCRLAAAAIAAQAVYLGALPAAAQHYASAKDASATFNGFKVDMAIGGMNGQANEYVYKSPNTELSRLEWRFDSVAVLTGGLTWTKNNFTIGAKGRINLTEDSFMDDYDFDDGECGEVGGICHSQHDNTRLVKSRMLDIHASYDVPVSGRFRVGAVAGYKWDTNKWKAYGGTANYGPIPEGLGVTYQQWWEAPYVGIQASGEWQDWLVLSGRVIGSWWAKGRDRDDHHLSKTLFHGDLGSGNEMVAVNLKAGYKVTDRWAVTLGYDYEKYITATGTLSRHNYGNGEKETLEGGAGANSEVHAVTVGVSARF